MVSMNMANDGAGINEDILVGIRLLHLHHFYKLYPKVHPIRWRQ